ncbi:MAG: hypothetical protein K2N44_13395 [Lachnospiraceae bacterium]|nr:hypothetical protein [Lachnospiraceae bacterium]
MLYIRADGNTEIGMGHVMRCLSVAEAAADIDHVYPPVFITADEGCRTLIEERGFRVIVLGTDYRDMMSELWQLDPLFQKQDVLLVDSYQADSEYYLALRKLVKVACFEDMGQAYPVDLLINYNIYAPDLEKRYKEQDSESGANGRFPQEVLLGAEYMPLRKAFQEPAGYVVNDKVTNVIATTGGSDPYFAMGAFADVLSSDRTLAGQGIHLHLISGPFNRFAGELKRKYQHDEVKEWHDCKKEQSRMRGVTITIHENVKDMRSLLLESDVVITATGSTIYEVSSLGVPMIVFYFAENQRQGAEALEKLTDIVNAGCFAKNPEVVADNVRETLKHCIRDKSYRELLHRQERELIDGKGARRIAEQLMRLAAETR